jgi:hypothetical protein
MRDSGTTPILAIWYIGRTAYLGEIY